MVVRVPMVLLLLLRGVGPAHLGGELHGGPDSSSPLVNSPVLGCYGDPGSEYNRYRERLGVRIGKPLELGQHWRMHGSCVVLGIVRRRHLKHALRILDWRVLAPFTLRRSRDSWAPPSPRAFGVDDLARDLAPP